MTNAAEPEAATPRTLVWPVEARDEGRTVGFILRQRLLLSSHTVRHAKFADGGCIFLDGAHVHTDAPVRAGQTVEVIVGDGADEVAKSGVEARAGALEIVYEDEDIIVLDKPAGLTMYPGAGHAEDSLGSRVLAHLKQAGVDTRLHAVHRLDVGTSGLVVIATNPHAQQRLQRQLHTKDFERTYLALVSGCPVPRRQKIMLPIGPSPDDHSIHCVRPDGKYAVTDVKVLESTMDGSAEADTADVSALGSDGIPDTHADASRSASVTAAPEDLLPGQVPAGTVSLVRLRLETGRTHQIRVHLSYIGCPLLGDAAYGSGDLRIDRPALHSSALSITHPVTGQRLHFTAPLPPDMHAVCTACGFAHC